MHLRFNDQKAIALAASAESLGMDSDYWCCHAIYGNELNHLIHGFQIHLTP